jgi:hypothetical protein
MATLPSLSNVASSITAGNFASTLSSTTGGLSSLTTSITGAGSSISSGLTSSMGGLLSGAGAAGGSAIDLLSKGGNLSGAGAAFTSGIGAAGVDLKTGKSAALEESAKTGSVKSAIDSVKGLAGSTFSKISDSFKALTPGKPQNLTAIDLKNKMDQVAADTKAAAPDTKSFTNGLSAAGVDLKTGKIPGVDAAVAAGGVGAGIGALSGAMGKVPGMSGIANINPSAMASGITNLPGGQSAAASLINSATGATSGVGDTLGGLNTITKNVSSAALNGISSATAGSSAAAGLLTGGALTGAGSAFAGALANPASALKIPGIPNLSGIPKLPGAPSVDSLTAGLQAGKQPLSSLATTGLSTAAAASLAASMNSVSTSSPFPIKMPTVAAATIDRSEVSGQVTNLLGDKKIPAPNYNPTPPVASSLSAEITAKRSEFITKKIAFDEEVIARRAALAPEKEKYIKIRDSLPEGDPVRIAARTEVNDKIYAFNAWSKDETAKLNAIQEEVNQLQKSEG